MSDPTHSLRPPAGDDHTLSTPGPGAILGDSPTATPPLPADGDTALADAMGEHLLELAGVSDPDPRGDDSVPVAPPGYELLGEVGRGGMGVVYRARDASLDRDVAVKVLQYRAAPNSSAARRFLDEARITAQLQHPGIPAVHQVGALPDGRPFLAMKLIKGRTLDELSRERPDPSADLGRFVAVFENIAQAVGYAHSRGVIHRDLKPANLMVGAFGEVQVMDWGLAKVLTGQGVRSPGSDPDVLGTEIRSTRGEDEETQTGSVLGTPAFMSPEQAIGAIDQVDARSDVFGLGGILCTILTGRPPYTGDTAESTRQLAARAKLDDALVRLASCGAEPDLVALCRRCLSPEKADRPADAGEVARAVADLRADAEGRARRAEMAGAEAAVRAAEERKRRRALLTSATVVAAVFAVGAGVSAWQAVRATAESDRARSAEKQKDDALDRVREEQQATAAALEQARQQQRNTFAALDTMTDDVVERLFARQPSLGENEKQFLRRVIALYQEAAKGQEATPESRTQVAGGHLKVARLQHVLGDLRSAEAGYAAARDEYLALAADRPDDLVPRGAAAAARLQLGVLLLEVGRLANARAEYEAARDAFRALADADPAKADYRSALAKVRHNLGQLLEHDGRLRDAEAEYVAARDLGLRLAAEAPAIPDYRFDLAKHHLNLGVLYKDSQRTAAAEEEFTAAQRLLHRLTTEQAGAPEYRDALGDAADKLGLLFAVTNRADRAEKEWVNASDTLSRLVADFPAVPAYRDRLAHVRTNFGVLYQSMRRPEKAGAEFAAAADLSRRLVADFPAVTHYRHTLTTALVNLASLKLETGAHAEARRLLEEGVPHHREVLRQQPSHPEYRAFFRHNRLTMAEALLALGDHAAVPPCVSEMLEYSPAPAADAFAAACLLAQCVPAAEQDTARGEQERAGLARRYADLSMEHLRRAVRLGWSDYARALKDRGLDPVRKRADFPEILAELKRKREPRETAPPPRPAR
jgi:tRNA A-37 threonylcarbamoyl transferase component Bud32/tetratricopeptide (TPR) repeat protein